MNEREKFEAQVADEQPAVEFQPMQVSALLKQQPEADEALELQDFLFAKDAVGVDLDGEPGWEQAYIPLFPNDTTLNPHNLLSVIYQTDTLKSVEEVEEFFEQTKLNGFYGLENQELSKVAFGKLAKRYGGMDYGKCVLITSEKPEKVAELPTYWYALAAFAGFLGLAGWQSLGLIGDIRRRIGRSKSDQSVTDAAGLASIFANSEPESPPKYERP